MISEGVGAVGILLYGESLFRIRLLLKASQYPPGGGEDQVCSDFHLLNLFHPNFAKMGVFGRLLVQKMSSTSRVSM